MITGNSPEELPSEPSVPQIDLPSIKTDSKDLVRRVGRKSLQATVYWCVAAVLCLFVNYFIGRFPSLIAIGLLLGATYQLTANFQWLAKTQVLGEDERRKWTIRLRWLTALVVLVALIVIARILL